MERGDEDSSTGFDDRPLYEQLAAAGFAGLPWRIVADRLVRYCYPRLQAWLHTGMIFEKCAKKGYGLARPSFRLAPDEISDLASNTAMAALNTFRNRCLAGEGWHPDGGTALTSWVFDDCLTAFPNEWRKFLTAQRRLQALDLRADATELLDMAWPQGGRHDPPADAVVFLRAEAEEALRATSPRLRRIVHLLALGYTRAEVCEILDDGLTPRAIEGQLYRLRHQLNQQQQAEEGQGR
jgi:hypothetical protein